MTPRKKPGGPLARKEGKRRMRRVVYIAVEGSETEWSYLRQDSIQRRLRDAADVSLKLVRHHVGQTDPRSLLRAMRKELSKADFRKGDEAWIVSDRDEWTAGQMSDVLEWADSQPAYHFVVSNPKFELFLLMHFEQVRGRLDAAGVDRRLSCHWADYRKVVPSGKFTIDEIRCAMGRARLSLTGEGRIPEVGSTQVHLLLESILGTRP